MMQPTRDPLVTTDTMSPSPSAPLRVRIGMDEAEYRVQDLSTGGFAITAAPPVGTGTVTHASFRLGAGLSISLQATARSWQPESDRQWFEFGTVDREILNLLLMWSDTSVVH